MTKNDGHGNNSSPIGIATNCRSHSARGYQRRYTDSMKSFTHNSEASNLRRLCLIRAVVVAGQWLALLVAKHHLGWLLPFVTLEQLLSAISIFALFCWWRSYQRWPVTDVELCAHLCVDIIAFSAVLYFSGGGGNPFISYLLVPLCIAATTLPLAFTWGLALLSMSAYGFLLFFYIPLEYLSPHAQHDMTSTLGHTANSHIVGMWINFMVSALLISYFISAMADTLRRKESELAQARERQLQDEQLLAVATLAAGTAHELATPLATMKIISEDLLDAADGLAQQDLAALDRQIDQCSDILQQLVATARELSGTAPAPQQVAKYLASVLDRWQLLRPDCAPTLAVSPAASTLYIQPDGTLGQSILNLLNNAADVSPADVTLDADCDEDYLRITIADRGPGLPGPEGQINKAYVSTKGKGLGLGLMLSHSSAQRFGGSLRWRKRKGGGSTLELTLPRKNIEVQP